MNIEKFEEYAKHNIENFCDAVFDGHFYVIRENSRLTKEKKQFLILSCNQSLRLWKYLNLEGYKLVPVEPTKDMITLGNEYYSESCSLSGLYKAMIGEENK